MSDDFDPAEVLFLVEQNQLATYYIASTAAFLIYDIAICFDQEMKYFWSKPQRPISWLYYIIRIFAILELLPGLVGTRYIILNEVLNVIFILAIDYVILLRVDALYSDERRMRMFLKIFFIISAITSIPLGLISSNLTDNIAVEFVPGLTICISKSLNVIEYSLSWGIVMLYGLTLMALALRKAAIIWKEAEGLTGMRLVNVLIRDQAIYFMVVVFVGVLKIIGTATTLDKTLSTIIFFIANPILLSPIGCRLLTNMKESGEQGVNAGTSCGLRSLTQMNFAEPVAQPEQTCVWDSVELAQRQHQTFSC